MRSAHNDGLNNDMGRDSGVLSDVVLENLGVNPFTGTQRINLARAVRVSIDTAMQPCEVNHMG